MALQRLAFGPLDESPLGRALKKLENLLGRTPVFGATRTVTAATTIIDSDDVVLVDTTGGSITVTLPPAATNLGRRFTMKKMVAANTMTLDGNGAETIDGAATVAVTVQYAARTVQSDGSGWLIVASVL